MDYETAGNAAMGAALVSILWLVAGLFLPEKVLALLPSPRAVLIVAAMITATVGFAVATILGG